MKTDQLKSILWSQFGASIDMLQNAISLCPEDIWDNEEKFWYNAYHCIFFLDYYLTPDPVNFTPPLPFDESEFEDRMPPRTYSKTEVLEYLSYCRKKCKSLIHELSKESIQHHWTNQSKTMDYNVVEILLYNMRHVQHHAAQLNLLLRQQIDDAPRWVRHAKDTI
ncbi:DinB family protein [Flagellimonas iocasae]|uniref:DinB family protein n=1 Tax=Flagellimonas iocasae TaxID=2055905 RepID=A0ABW4XY76_9FLAO